MDKLRVIELFAGIGAQASALERLGIPFESTVCENDPKAYRAYCAIHGDTPNLGDITKVEHLPECDLITYSFPCTDLSIAGKQMGMSRDSGTRSSLLWEVERLLKDMRERDVLPEVLVMENVDAILNKKNIDDFNIWIRFLDDIGYCSSYEILNAKDYGVPQNRKRCFMVSTRTLGQFKFPPKIPLDKRLKDVLEDDVPEGYYLSDERIAKYQRTKQDQHDKGRGFGWDPRTPEQIATTTTTTSPTKDATMTVIVKTKDQDDVPKIEVAGELDGSEFVDARRVTSPNGISPALTTVHPGIGQIKIEVAGNLNQPGRHTQGNLVYGIDGQSPTILAVHNNNVTKIEVAGDLHNPGRFDQGNRVYGIDGQAPTLGTMAGGDNVPKIEVAGDLNASDFEYNNRVYSPDGTSPTVSTVHSGIGQIKIEESRGDSE